MNKRVEQIIEEHKQEFLIEHGLYEKEYAPYTIAGEGYAVDDLDKKELIKFRLNTKK